MKLISFLTLLLALTVASAQAPAQGAGDGEWLSYRDAYRAMLWFEKYGKPKQFIQSHFQVMAGEKGASLDGLHLWLKGKTTQLNLPLDGAGRAVFPLLKSAYDENALLTINRKLSQYRFAPRISIVIRADGVYDAFDLRAACDQALDFERYRHGAAALGKKCVGVRFAFAHSLSSEAPVKFRRPSGELASLPVGEGPAFDGDLNDGFRTALYRFIDWPDKGQLLSLNAPVAIAAVFE
jgi:hypothetical protein